MSLHLIKLCVGIDTIDELASWQKRRKRIEHWTRMTPKRVEELLDGGSIYWIIKGWLCARQKLLEFRPLEIDGIKHCGLVFDKEIVRISPRPHRPFQGWRYFAEKDIPADLVKGKIEYDMPEQMLRELTLLGLI